VSARYQMCVASIGGDLSHPRDRMVKAVLEMGHIPIDLVATGLLREESHDTVDAHLGRTDYLILLVGRSEDIAPKDLAAFERAYTCAGELGVPVLGLVEGGSAPPRRKRMSIIGHSRPGGMESFIQTLQGNPNVLVESLDGISDSAAWVLIRLIEKYRRPGWVSATTLPSGNVASELARLSAENAEFRSRLESLQTDDEARLETRLEAARRALLENMILIPLWDRSSNRWEKPVETSLHEFFVRLAPELVVESSLSDASQFVPTGVCELDPGDFTSRWVVPPNSLNLWFTDLMALGLVQPSLIKHHAKDVNQYWTLTGDGREMLSRVRRSVLATGGHRHVGFTAEHPIPVRPNTQ
jgi:hypothetical protein